MADGGDTNSDTDHVRHRVDLRGGNVPTEGNVFVDGQPVCDDSWDLSDAVVTCRMLGYIILPADKLQYLFILQV